METSSSCRRAKPISQLLAGSAAVVVGGSRGIGLAVAELLAAEGAGVVVIGRGPDAVEAAAQRISGVGYAGSPSDPSEADALIETRTTNPVASILANCAGTAGWPASHSLPSPAPSSTTCQLVRIPRQLRQTGHPAGRVRANGPQDVGRALVAADFDYQEHVEDTEMTPERNGTGLPAPPRQLARRRSPCCGRRFRWQYNVILFES